MRSFRSDDVPKWKILPDSGGKFQFVQVSNESSDQKPLEALDRNREVVDVRFPSVKDFVHKNEVAYFAGEVKQDFGIDGVTDGGRSNTRNCGSQPFRTASVRAVSVKDSSARKAASVLEEHEDNEKHGDDAAVVSFRQQHKQQQEAPLFATTFKTNEKASSSSKLVQRFVPRGEGFPRRDVGILFDGETNSGGLAMFQSGSGRPISSKQSSIYKGASILQDKIADTGLEFPCHRNTSDEYLPCDTTSRNHVSQKEPSFDGTTSACEERFPMFRTGSGKKVSIKQSSMKKAMAVLGETIVGDVHISPEHLAEDLPKALQYNTFASASSSSAVKFHNTVPRSLPITRDAMQNTRDLLGESAAYGRTSLISSNKNVQSSRCITQLPCKRMQQYSVLDKNSQGLEFPCHRNTSGEYLPCDTTSRNHVSQKEPSFDETTSACEERFPMFRTGSGKKVSIKQSSMKKAMAVLGETIVGDVHISPEHLAEDLPKALQYNTFASASSSSAVKFHNTVPRSLPITRDAMQNTRDFHGESAADGSTSLISLNKNVQSSRCITQLPCKRMQQSSVLDKNSQDMPSEKFFSCEKTRTRMKHYSSPFKKPRNIRFSSQLNNNTCFVQSSFIPPISKDCYHKPRISTRYPFLSKRKSLKEYFGGPPSKTISNLPEDILTMSPATARNYQFHGSHDSEMMGVESFRRILLQLGASPSYTTMEWVSNHYKWIVWKLACQERGYSTQGSRKYLTTNNVLEELKYRYEREVNNGHSSAIKAILDGSRSPASMVVLCVTTIYSRDAKDGKSDDKASSSNLQSKPINSQDGYRMKIELTDGWYSINAILDEGLSNHLLAGKLFVGQKLRLWGSGLCGWVGPVSPFKASESVNLMINLNGTYRVSWEEKMGFCKIAGMSLSFNCIKVVGGPIPRTLVGVSRIYPILYKERFPDGSSIIRTERMEKKLVQLYDERCSNIAEEIRFYHEYSYINDSHDDETAKTFQMLQSCSEPELLMADMSFEQLTAINMYQKRKQNDLDKNIQKAFEDVGLVSRDVTPFRKVRVIGLYSKVHPRTNPLKRKNPPKEGLITIWNPTEKQKFDLVEGQIYSVSKLEPLNIRSNLIHLQSKGSMEWTHIPSSDVFESFFTPRISVSLSHIGKVLLTSEFDIAAVVVYVGEAYVSGHQRKQWIFLTDGSLSDTDLEIEKSHSLLAVCFCMPYVKNDSSAFTSQDLLGGSTVCFYNLVKKPRDEPNNLWVAEATENATYDIYPNLCTYSHLKEDALAVEKWAKLSSLKMQKLKERALEVISSCR